MTQCRETPDFQCWDLFMILPIRADFPLPGLPALTVLVCLICFAVFMKQSSDWNDFEHSVTRYCDGDRTYVPENPDYKFAYNTASWNPSHMLSASFAHADWAQQTPGRQLVSLS